MRALGVWSLVCLLVVPACRQVEPRLLEKNSHDGVGRGTQPSRTAQAPVICPARPAIPENPATRGHYRAGGLYWPGLRDSAPSQQPNMACVVEPIVRDEAYSLIGNQSPYTVLNRRYVVRRTAQGYVERGLASYYGIKFHGRLTSNHEVYDTNALTAAHRTLPLPSYALVTNLDNNASVVVRVNDRGPFHPGRIIDLSYAAAVKIGIVNAGTGRVEVRGVTAADQATILAHRSQANGTNSSAAPATQSSHWSVERQTTPRDGQQPNPFVALPLHPVQPNQILSAVAVPSPNTAVLRWPSAAVLQNKTIVIEVADFGSPARADQALAQLTLAGIPGARIGPVVSQGQSRWRLTVPAHNPHNAIELARRIIALGYHGSHVATDEWIAK